MAEVGGEPAGFALWFSTFSTFRGQPGLYLEDIFVKPAYRGRGIGKGAVGRRGAAGRRARLRAAGMVGARLERPCDRVLPVFGARPMDDWTVYRIDDEPLRRLAEIAPEW